MAGTTTDASPKIFIGAIQSITIGIISTAATTATTGLMMRIDRTQQRYNDGLYHGEEEPLPERDEIVGPLRSYRIPGAVGPGAEG